MSSRGENCRKKAFQRNPSTMKMISDQLISAYMFFKISKTQSTFIDKEKAARSFQFYDDITFRLRLSLIWMWTDDSTSTSLAVRIIQWMLHLSNCFVEAIKYDGQWDVSRLLFVADRILENCAGLFLIFFLVLLIRETVCLSHWSNKTIYLRFAFGQLTK